MEGSPLSIRLIPPKSVVLNNPDVTHFDSAYSTTVQGSERMDYDVFGDFYKKLILFDFIKFSFSK